MVSTQVRSASRRPSHVNARLEVVVQPTYETFGAVQIGLFTRGLQLSAIDLLLVSFKSFLYLAQRIRLDFRHTINLPAVTDSAVHNGRMGRLALIQYLDLVLGAIYDVPDNRSGHSSIF